MDNKRKNTENGKLHTDNSASPYRTEHNSRDEMRHGNAQARKTYGTRPVIKATENTNAQPIRLYNRPTERDKNRKIERERKSERLKKQRISTALGLMLAVVLAIVIMFMTPLFAIKEIRLNGNDTVPKELINTHVGDLIGANLFSTSIGNIENKMTNIPQIREVDIKKAIFPARLEMYITESRPAGYVVCNNDILVVDSDLRIIDDASTFDQDKLPSISGISVSDYELNTILEIKSQEKKEILISILKAFEHTGLTEYVKYVSIDDITAISFNYDNRLDVLCGSRLELERKVSMFAESIATPTFDENSIGTVDVSVPGTAVYSP